MNVVVYPRRPNAACVSSVHAHSGIFESLHSRELA